ncbi:MAG: hypothetical protein HYV09_39375 [Deltaproteobacteria bacterium]|nr:hypothetical protein [Deltaproteobacteria bacterium]
MSLRAITALALAMLVPWACGRREEPNPPAPAPSAPLALAPSMSGAVAALQSAAVEAKSPLNDPPQNAEALASAIASASASPSPSGSASVSASASASASASTSATAGPLAKRLVGPWVFSRFDLSDPATAKKWGEVPKEMQKDILAEAPKATIEFTPTKLVSRLAGVPDKTTTWVPESETDGELVIKTGDEGRKKIRFPDADTMRIEELDKKGAFVTVFARKPPGAAAAPSGSASAK